MPTTSIINCTKVVKLYATDWLSSHTKMMLLVQFQAVFNYLTSFLSKSHKLFKLVYMYYSVTKIKIDSVYASNDMSQ